MYVFMKMFLDCTFFSVLLMDGSVSIAAGWMGGVQILAGARKFSAAS
jgi:hypothetical protein